MSADFFSTRLGRILFSDRLKSGLFKHWYRYVSKTIGRDAVCFFNYGYAGADADRIELAESDEANRTYIQLYHAVAGGVDLRDRDVMEMSCGRGGGADYVAEYLKPRLTVGVDRTESAVSFCRKHLGDDSLAFVCGDALSFPFGFCRFDAVINVEASHCYPDVSRFLSEVNRVLKPGGLFLYTDFRKTEVCPAWHEKLSASGLQCIQQEDITGAMVRGLELNDGRTRELIQEMALDPYEAYSFNSPGHEDQSCTTHSSPDVFDICATLCAKMIPRNHLIV